MIIHLLFILTLIPLFAFFLCMLFPGRFEKTISTIAIASVIIDFVGLFVLLYNWQHGAFAPLVQQGATIYLGSSYTFALDFFFDGISAVFFMVACITTLLIFIFSKYYMHRESGFKRFYMTILFFFFGLALIIFAGNFETLFIGWESIGISSFILIAYYRDRYLPTKNALKVFSLYRMADALFLIALWYAHHLFEANIHFSDFNIIINQHGNQLFILGLLFLMVAIIKSAQFPFSYWLPRAMEGPTTSSAIFYGALSVHMGLFVLLRTYPLWEGSIGLKVAIAVIGLISALIATSIARVQSSIKTQIAYASITQIGIMFIELALGLQWLVLLHFISNAFLRTYQLLISPSIVGYLVHDQFFYFVPPHERIRDNFMGKIKASLYVLGIREWGMDTFMSRILWEPLKYIGRKVYFLDYSSTILSFVVFALAIFLSSTFFQLNATLIKMLSLGSAFVSILFAIRSFTQKGDANKCWDTIIMAHLFIFISLFLSYHGTKVDILIYLSGIVTSFILGHACLNYLKKRNEIISLSECQGHMYEYPITGNIFFIACLGLMLFPITPSFLGEELLLKSIHIDQWLEISLFGIGFFLMGVNITRIFAKIFFGPHKKTYHEVAYKSA